MPNNSRTKIAIDPAAAWTKTDILQLEIYNAVNYLAWTKTKNAAKGRKPPEPLLPDELKSKRNKNSIINKDLVTLDIDEMKKMLLRPRI